MALIDELKEMRAAARDRMSECLANASSYEELASVAREHIADLDRAIAALEPIEPPTIEEVLSLVPDDQPELFDAPDQSETTESDPDPVLRAFEDDQIVAPAWIDEQTCEPVNPHVEPEAPALDESMLGPRDEDASVFSDEPAEGYAPVVAADEPEPEPSLLDRFNPFRVKADA